MSAAGPKGRELLIDFYRSCAMLFVFYHHTANVFPDSVDLFTKFNPFAELFVVISGFMVGYVYLHKERHGELVVRGLKVLAAYFVISVPVAIGMAVLGKKREPVGQAIFDVLTFQSEPTCITILKFYGLMFLLLPLILLVFKRRRLLVLALSAAIFVACTWFSNTTTATEFENPAVILLLFSLQAQMFFMIGIWLGDLHRSNRLIGPAFYTALAGIFIFGLLLDYGFGFPSNGEKYPYRFDKLLNLLWTLPLLLALLWAVFARTRRSPAVALILNVGQNSLIAFLGSEVVRQAVKLALLLGGVHPQVYGQTMMGLFDVVLVTAVLWLYRARWQNRQTVLHPLSGP
ncbi:MULTISPECIES: OpgC domain-containing protein [unclassified Bradyrhizobium]|uniref:OpgC domain-containing protein n=1 Tax=unclassified Bradyrhizobium TaxID=2631580 RepID=UPI0028E71DCA|nr:MULTISPECIES: OpgC domain-containing protein [unclassified Bradyrhizobium]